MSEEKTVKKAILIVSNGTSDIEALAVSIERFEERVREEFEEYEVFRAFSSEKIISKIKKKHNIEVGTPLKVLKNIENQSFEEVIIQPLFIVCGVEYEMLKNDLLEFEKSSSIKKIILGNPILIPNDNIRTVNFIERVKSNFEANKNIVLMVHGTKSSINKCYWELNDAFKSCGLNNIYVGAAEGEPSIDYVIKSLKNNNIKSVLLMPFLIVAGFHAKRDLDSDSPKSWKSILQNEGIEVETKRTGLGELKGFQEFFIRDLKKLLMSK